MRRMLLCCFSVAVMVGAVMSAQAPTPAAPAPQGRQTAPATGQPRPTTPAPAAPAPAPRRPAPAPARGGVLIVVTDMAGNPLRDIRIRAMGPTERGGTTDGTGRLTITGMPAGTYRLRFTGDSTVEFEREVAVRGGPNSEVDVVLRPAPPPVVVAAPPPPPAPAPAPTVELGPVGQPQALSTIDGFVTKAFQEGPRQEVLLSCSTNTRTTLVQMGPTQPERLYESAEATYFVLSGEGIVHMDGKDTSLKLDGFVSVPRGVSHSLTRTGRKPLIFIMQLSGEPCEQAK